MAKHEAHEPNPRRVAAGRRNRSRRGPLSATGLQRLREAALRHRPWRYATGPKTAAGKARVAQNGKKRQCGPHSVRDIRAELSRVRPLLRELREVRRQVEKQGGLLAIPYFSDA